MSERVTHQELVEALRDAMWGDNHGATENLCGGCFERYEALLNRYEAEQARPQDDDGTVEVKVAVAIMPNGDWAAWGSNYYVDDPQSKAAQNLNHDHWRSQRKTFHWVKARVPIPREGEFHGTLE